MRMSTNLGVGLPGEFVRFDDRFSSLEREGLLKSGQVSRHQADLILRRFLLGNHLLEAVTTEVQSYCA